MNDPLGVHVGGDDDELAAIRARRAAQIQQGAGARGGMPQTEQSKAAQEERQKAAEDQRSQILKAILEPAARERLSTIAVVKPDKARKIEDMLIMNAKRGAFSGQVSDEQLKQMLETISEQSKTGSKVTIQRRRDMDDDW